MLLLGDRNFPSWKLWAQLRRDRCASVVAGQGGSRLLSRLGTFTDGSWVGGAAQAGHRRRVGCWVRVIEYTVTVTTTDPGTGELTRRTELFRLLSTICDPDLVNTGQLAACTSSGGKFENGYQELKTFQRGPRTVLLLTDPDGVYQELYAYLITYQAIRTLIVAAADVEGIDPDPVVVHHRLARSPTMDHHRFNRDHHRASRRDPGRPDRDRPGTASTPQTQLTRAVKRSQAPYPAKRHATQQKSTTVDYHIHLIPDPVNCGNA